MMMRSHSRLLVIVLAFLALAGAVLFWYQRGSLKSPLLNGAAPGTTLEVTTKGTLRMEFMQPVNRESVERGFSIEPRIEGRLEWSSDRELLFSPASPLAPEQVFTALLAAGVESASGERLRKPLQWEFFARQPRVLYLSPIRAPEIWSVSPGGTAPVQLTSTGGAVYDYAVSMDGAQVVFSARNDQNGLDLWEMTPPGKAEILLPCGPDWCFSPAISPDGSRLAYSRRVFSGISGSEPGAPRLWMMRAETGETDLLFVDPNISGSAAGWSPDGRYLAFVDAVGQSVGVVDFEEDEDFFIPTGDAASFSWAPDSLTLLVTRSETTEAFPYTAVYRVNMNNRAEILWIENDIAGYSAPALSADGKQAVVARRAVDGVPGKQLWLVDPGGRLVRDLTGDPLGNYAGYQWDPTGWQLAYQRLEMSGSDSRPAVVIWDRETDISLTLAEDAFLPHWAP